MSEKVLSIILNDNNKNKERIALAIICAFIMLMSFFIGKFDSTLIVLLSFLYITFGAIRSSDIRGSTSSLIDRDSSIILRGVMCLIVVFSHYHYYFSPGFFRIFDSFGYIGVGFFLFCSGYGINLNYLEGEKSLKHFWKKHFIKIIIPYWICFVFALITDSFFGENIKAKRVISSVFTINSLLPFAWYVTVILIWYTLFFLATLLPLEKKYCKLCINVSIILITLLLLILRAPSYYYKTLPCLFLGFNYRYLNRFKHSFLLFCVFLFTLIALHKWGGTEIVFME